MPTPHIEAQVGEIAPLVIMPGDPLRAKYIAENFLEDAKLVNDIRAMYAYTGTYKGTAVTVMGSGMGMPSMGIYAYELYKFYDVEKIIRIGTCGGYDKQLQLLDIILADQSYSETKFAYTFSGDTDHVMKADPMLTNTLADTASEMGIDVVRGTLLTSEGFDYYIDKDAMMARIPENVHCIGAEMECFALFYLAKFFHKKAACLATVVDKHDTREEVSAEDRETALQTMIKIALEAIIRS